MRGDHLSDRVGVHETDKQDEWHEVLVQDLGVEPEVDDNESPGAEERSKSKERIIRSVAAGTSDVENVADALKGVEREYQASVEHVEVTKVHGVSGLGQGGNERHTKSGKHWLLPVAAATFDGGNCIDNAESQDAFHGAGDQAKSKSMSVVLIPGLHVEGKEGWERSAKDSKHEHGADTNSRKVRAPSSILAQSSWQQRKAEPRGLCSRHPRRGRKARREVRIALCGVCDRDELVSRYLNDWKSFDVRLSAIYCIKSLVQEKPNGP